MPTLTRSNWPWAIALGFLFGVGFTVAERIIAALLALL